MTPTNQNIESLIALCKSNNQKAQFEIYNRYYKAMFNISYRIVKDKFEAEDIIQDSFLTAFSKLDSLKDNSIFGAWLKRIVVNNSIYHYNKNNKYQSTALDNVLYKIEDTSTTAHNEEHDITQLKAKNVLDGLSKLKDSYRVFLTLHFIEGYDYEEISSIMNVSYGNCRTTISRAKQSLKTQLQSKAK